MSAPPKRKALVTCEGKNRYPDDIGARAAAMDALQRYGNKEGVTALWVYKCGECDGWHLTKQRRPDKFKVTAENPVHG